MRKYSRNSRQSGSGFDRPSADIACLLKQTRPTVPGSQSCADIERRIEPTLSPRPATRQERIIKLEKQMAEPNFWSNHESAGRTAKELSNLQNELAFWQDLENKLASYQALDETQLTAAAGAIRQFKKNFDKQYLKVFLSGQYDRGNALLYIYAGAGGVDAQDWASMLLKMYQKYAINNDWGWTLLDQSLGEQSGTKSAVIEVTGRYAYGYLKGEAGVHRLVRISPFSSQSLRHTSFALIDILPEIAEAKLQLDPKDLRIDTYRSSGPGGQNVNKLETAVRITHLPTNVAVAVQSERSQAQNKAKAMQLLESRLTQRLEAEKVKTLSELRSDTKDASIEWSNQIRSYVLNPYKSVKDHRSGVESSQPERVLEGELDEFIEAELTYQHD